LDETSDLSHGDYRAGFDRLVVEMIAEELTA
jgi:hypothetical protein